MNRSAYQPESYVLEIKLVDAGIQDRGHRAVEDRCLRDRQLGGVGTQGLADEALLEGATLVGGCGQAGGAAGGHPVREGQDSGVVGRPAVARRRIAAEDDAHVLVDEFLEPSQFRGHFPRCHAMQSPICGVDSG